MAIENETTNKPSRFDAVKLLFNITRGIIMADWKTTITGVIGAVAWAVNYFTGAVIPGDIIALATAVAVAYLAPDKKK